jgi:SOS-response transcriptional repressor LexA
MSERPRNVSGVGKREARPEPAVELRFPGSSGVEGGRGGSESDPDLAGEGARAARDGGVAGDSGGESGIDWDAIDIVEVWRELNGFGTPRWDDRLIETGAATSEYYEWFAREARARQTPEERAETERFAAKFARRLTADWSMRGLATRLRVRTRRGRGLSMPASRELDGSTALRIAAQTRSAPIIELGAAAGGGRALWEEPVTAYLSLPEDVPSGAYVALTVSGDSMEPLMHDGDRVLVKLGGEPRKDTVIVARLPDDGYVIKRVGRLEPDAIELVSLNPAYAPFWIARDEAPVLGQVVVRWCDHDAQ